MKAAWIERYGGPDMVEIRDVPKPEPGPKDILVRVEAASVNRADLDEMLPRWQFLRLATGLRRPRRHRIGSDVAGVVEAVGERVNRFKVGDRVFGDLFAHGHGAFAEYVSAAEKAFALIPADMSFETAATLPHSAVLALQGLRLKGGRTAEKGARVMVIGASGNVGPFAVQIAKSRGAHVTGVASTDKLDFVRSLGADEVIDYRTTDYTRPAEPYDWILDVDAHHPVRDFRRALRPGGVYAAEGGSARWFLSLLFWQPIMKLTTDKTMGMMLHWKPFNPPDIEELKRLVAAGAVVPQIDRRFSLDDAAGALRYVQSGQARGKVVVTPN
jgi:NADPH:quinone reductase-like Zn-dependent oxidoreductase